LGSILTRKPDISSRKKKGKPEEKKDKQVFIIASLGMFAEENLR
jgi:hypothetical protein